MQESEDTKDAQREIIRRARDFTTSYNVEIGELPFGANVIHAAYPYKGDGWFDRMFTTYEFAFVGISAQYKLYIEYASAGSRPCQIYWDDRLITTGSIDGVTGGWEEAFQRWEYQGIVSANRLNHTLKIERKAEPIPHIRTIRLALETGN